MLMQDCDYIGVGMLVWQELVIISHVHGIGHTYMLTFMHDSTLQYGHMCGSTVVYYTDILWYTHSCILTHTLSQTCITSERHCCVGRYIRYSTHGGGQVHYCVYTWVRMVHSTHTLRSSYIVIDEGFYPWVGTPGSPHTMVQPDRFPLPWVPLCGSVGV